MARAKISCLTLTNWTFGALSRDINTLSNKYWTNCPMNIEYLAYYTENVAPFVTISKI